MECCSGSHLYLIFLDVGFWFVVLVFFTRQKISSDTSWIRAENKQVDVL